MCARDWSTVHRRNIGTSREGRTGAKRPRRILERCGFADVHSSREDAPLRLQIAAKHERNRNDAEMKRQNGQSITYGSTVQLLHCASNKFLTVYKRESATVERNSLRVALDCDGNEGSYFDVEPHWKHSRLGNPVRVLFARS